MSIHLIGAAIDQCAGVSGAADTPQLVNSYSNKIGLSVDPILSYESNGHNLSELNKYFTDLANTVYQALEKDDLPIVIGGDHSCAIGTWSGVHHHLANKNETLGLICIDAHMDSHTPETTLSGNIHGMPIAVLLGHGYSELTSILNKNPKLNPENIILMGIRSYEEGEANFLSKLGVKIYYNYDITKLGFHRAFTEAIEYLNAKVDKIGLTIDVDGFDPEFAPGVGTCEPDGIDFNHFMHELRQLDFTKLIALEIVEANNRLDSTGKTMGCVLEIIRAIKSLSIKQPYLNIKRSFILSSYFKKLLGSIQRK